MLFPPDVQNLTGGRLGVHDIACPSCGPLRTSPANRRRRVLRIWAVEPGFATYCCARCGIAGHSLDRDAIPVNPGAIERARQEATETEIQAKAARLRKALWLWAQSVPIGRTVAERYLREARQIACPLPATLRFLPPRGEHGPAMIAAFALAAEPTPCALAVQSITGVHITRLRADGSGKAGNPSKIMIGHSIGTPIVLAPPNDLLGLALTEGIEDALAIHQATGLGAWAAGSASLLPALARAIPEWIDFVTIMADDDAAGVRGAHELSAALTERGIAHEALRLAQCEAA